MRYKRPYDPSAFRESCCREMYIRFTHAVVNIVKVSVAAMSQRVGQMKLLSAEIIIGRFHQIYRKKNAEHYAWTRLEIYRVRNYHETGVSTMIRLGTALYCTRRTRYQAHRIRTRGKEIDR